MCAALFWCTNVLGTEPEAVGTETEGQDGAEIPSTADPEGLESIPTEWIAEIMENQEMLESLELLERLELFGGEDRFSSHRFE
jgi:hypothetical protein